ncbi:MAG: hypothetical protein M3040_15075 [Bacteroidota bacterium]|nr:hypothetical protein [Bacteroidota bacterium]
MEEDKVITVNSHTKIGDVQTAFEVYYPFLKIEFSKNSLAIFSKTHKVSADILIGKISHFSASVNLKVGVDRTIDEVEKDCYELLGLSTQICRKSGNVWNPISITNSWTLQSQNSAGEFISTEMQKVV